MQHQASFRKPYRGLIFLGALFLASCGLAVPWTCGQVVTPVGIGTVDNGEVVFSPVVTWEWNTDDDFEGWVPNNVNNDMVSGGLLSGESLGDGSSPNALDPMFSSPNGLGLVIGNGSEEVSRIQFNLQLDIGAPTSRTELFLFCDAGIGSQAWPPAEYPTITDGLPHTYTLDFDAASPIWGWTINSLRLDPVADNPNVVDTFAYDFIKLGSVVDPGTIPGDVNEDGDVDADDFELIRANFFGINVGRSQGDLNQDGIVDLVDFGEWKDNFPFPAGGYLALLVGAVPEPGACILLAMGGVLLVTRSAWRRRH